MDRLALMWFSHEAERALYRKHATTYQDHFNDLMEAVHGADFIRVRPAGRAGDRKCDGYLQSINTVFQVYAPTTVVIRDWTKKIKEDFAGAQSQWKDMRGWTFVHNQHDGLPPDVAQEISNIKTDNASLSIDNWPPSRLLELSHNLPESRLLAIFGNPPRDDDMRKLDRGDIARVVAGLSDEAASWRPESPDLPVVSPEKLTYNKLSAYPSRLITAGIAQSGMVEEYFNNHSDPNLRDRNASLLRQEWQRLRGGTTADVAFDRLFELVGRDANGSRDLTASLALLAYFFEACDIFDNPPIDALGLAT